MPSLDEMVDMIRVKPGKKFRLKDHDPSWAGDKDVPKKERKAFAVESLSQNVDALAKAQELLYAADSHAILLVFQAMDAAGKDSTIKHVMSGVNPQGCQVVSFKQSCRRNSTTISCGAAPNTCPSAGASGSSTVPTTRRSWSCACIRRS